jgi:hypothetical protein
MDAGWTGRYRLKVARWTVMAGQRFDHDYADRSNDAKTTSASDSRLRDPLLQPYVIMRGLRSEKITDADLRQFRSM